MQLKLENISARKNFSISFYIQKKFTLSKKGIPSKKNFFDHSNYSKLTRLLNVPVLNRRKKKFFFSFSRQRKERSFLFHQFKVFQPYYPVPLRTSRIPPHSCGPASHLFSVFFVFFFQLCYIAYTLGQKPGLGAVRLFLRIVYETNYQIRKRR